MTTMYLAHSRNFKNWKKFDLTLDLKVIILVFVIQIKWNDTAKTMKFEQIVPMGIGRKRLKYSYIDFLEEGEGD